LQVFESWNPAVASLTQQKSEFWLGNIADLTAELIEDLLDELGFRKERRMLLPIPT
jgi:hypothetical protein